NLTVTNRDATAVRCAYLTNGAVLIGFTLTNGGTWRLDPPPGLYDELFSGAGVWCESMNSWLSNCVLTGNGNNAADRGGGAYKGTLANCKFIGNKAEHGGAAYQARLNDCMINDNSAESEGGGVCESIANHCTFTGNWGAGGGGACYSTLDNCTFTGNMADYGG